MKIEHSEGMAQTGAWAARLRRRGDAPPRAIEVADRQHVRMFVLSHVFGPVLGLSLCLFLLLAGFPLDYRIGGFAALVALFWVYPAALRATRRHQLLSLCSLEHLQLTILWACHGYGGLMSPFLLWLAIVPLLAFLYLSPSPRLWLGLIATLAANIGLFILLSTLLVAPPPADPAALSWLAFLSFACASAYVGLMAANFSRILSSRALIDREAADHEATVADLGARLARLKHAEQAKAQSLARLGEEARAPLSALQTCCGLLLQDEAPDRAGDETELKSIGEATGYLGDVINDIVLYSQAATGAQTVEAVEVDALLERVASEIRPLIGERTELVVHGSDAVMINTDGKLLESALSAIGRHVAQLPLGRRLEWRASRLSEADSSAVVIEIAEAREAQAELPLPQQPTAARSGGSGKAAGYGLSLALAGRICERLGGSLTTAPGTPPRLHFRLEVPALA